MKRFTMFACLTMALVFAVSAVAADDLQQLRYVDGHRTIHGASLNADKAAVADSIVLIGPWDTPLVPTAWGNGGTIVRSHEFVNGEFEDENGAPDLNGFTGVDNTQKTSPIWHVDTYEVVSGVYSAWCGEIGYDPWVPEDPQGGYGSNYNEMLVWNHQIEDETKATTINIEAVINHDTEPGYDTTALEAIKLDLPADQLFVIDGDGQGVVVSAIALYNPGEYLDTNWVKIMWHVVSDGGWDDSDGDYYGNGACQLDDVSITLVNNTYLYRFPALGVLPGDVFGFEDQTLGEFVVEYPTGVGDYMHILSVLEDEDPCASDYSPQVNFIDDNVVIPGTGGSQGQDWTYGPGGYIVTTLGGLAGPDFHIDNWVQSPIIETPGTQLENDYLPGWYYRFNTFRHEDLSADAPGMFYVWGIRSSNTGVAADIEDAGFQDRGWVYYGGPDYIRAGDVACGDLMVSLATHVQVLAGCYEIGWVWNYDGNDGYPAPYFDNFRLLNYDFQGPSMVAREIDLAQDVFPEDAVIDYDVLANNNCRFDMANNISLEAHEWNDPGDSIVMDIVLVRTDAVWEGTPTLYYTIDANPTYAGVARSMPLTGTIPGVVAVGNGVPSPTGWAFDLDEVAEASFLFPGDVLHYYVEAADNVNGDIQTTTVPGDLTGYGDFSHPLAYNSTYVVHALPTMKSDAPGDQPGILFWNDFANRGGEEEWYLAFDQLGLKAGEDYDIFYTNGPSSSVSNGLGGRATANHIQYYNDMLYTAGDLTTTTISNLDYANDAGDDVGLLDLWMGSGGKDLFITGDEVAFDMATASTQTQNFVSSYMGITVSTNDIRLIVDGQTAPVVLPVLGAGAEVSGDPGIFDDMGSWIAYGGCFVINTFDGVEVNGGVRLATFANEAGVDGGWSISAATLFTHANTSRVISMPYDFMYIWNDPSEVVPDKAGQPASLTARTRVLRDVLAKFNVTSNPGLATGTDVAVAKFAVSNAPNPFNPQTEIKFNLPKAGDFSLKVFNVRGELVKTLINEVREAGEGSIVWDGTSNQGSRVASGVYFYEARTADNVEVNKMALVK